MGIRDKAEIVYSAQSKRNDAALHHTAEAEIIASDIEEQHLCHVCLRQRTSFAQFADGLAVRHTA